MKRKEAPRVERTQKKLHSRRGASILLALLLFLVASMVVSVILSASLTAVSRVNDDREREQEYLAVSSAAKFFAKALERASYRVTTTTQLDEEKNPVPEGVVRDFSELRGLDGVLAAADSGEKTIRVTLRLPDGVDTALPKTASVTLTLGDPDGNGIYEFTGAVAAEGSSQKMFLKGQLQKNEGAAHTMTEHPDPSDPDAESFYEEQITTWSCSGKVSMSTGEFA